MIYLPQWINHVYVQIAFTLVVFPCLLLAYTGQAAYIIDHKDHVADAFYRSIPGYWTLNKFDPSYLKIPYHHIMSNMYELA